MLIMLQVDDLAGVLLFPVFPIVSYVIWFGLFVVIATIILISDMLVSGSLDIATNIPIHKDKFLPIAIAHFTTCFSLFSVFFLLSPEEIISNLPLGNFQFIDFMTGTLSNIQTSTDLLVIALQFLFFPVLSTLIISLIKWHRLMSYGWSSTELKNRNKTASGIVKTLKFLFFSSVVLLMFFTFIGRTPSGYSLINYYSILFTIALPSSVFLGWIANKSIIVMAHQIEKGNVKLAVLNDLVEQHEQKVRKELIKSYKSKQSANESP